MGCKECKSKKGQMGTDSMEIPLVPKDIVKGEYNGNFYFKVVTFLGVSLLLPFIIVGVMVQMFVTFFVTKSKFDLSSKFVNILTTIVKWYGKRKAIKELKRREKEFSDTTSYDGDDDYEVYETEEYTVEDILEDAETLDWENLSNPKVKKGNNKKGQ